MKNLKKFLKIACYASLIIALFGCGTKQGFQKRMNRWIGHSKYDIRSSWGIPENVGQDLGDNGVLIYKRKYIEGWCFIAFYYRNNTVYEVNFEGSGCRAVED